MFSFVYLVYLGTFRDVTKVFHTAYLNHQTFAVVPDNNMVSLGFSEHDLFVGWEVNNLQIWHSMCTEENYQEDIIKDYFKNQEIGMKSVFSTFDQQQNNGFTHVLFKI